MKKTFSEHMTRLSGMVQWMTIMYVFLFSTNALAAAYMTATVSVSWSTLSGQERMNIAIGIYAVWSNTMMVFLLKSVQKAVKGELPLPIESSKTDETTIITKQSTTTPSVTPTSSTIK